MYHISVDLFFFSIWSHLARPGELACYRNGLSRCSVPDIWCHSYDYFRDNLLNLAESGVKAITIAPELRKIFALANLLDKDKNQRWVLREPQLRSLPSSPRAVDQTSRVDSPSTINIADQSTRFGHDSDLLSHKQSHPKLTIFQIYLIHFTQVRHEISRGQFYARAWDPQPEFSHTVSKRFLTDLITDVMSVQKEFRHKLVKHRCISSSRNIKMHHHYLTAEIRHVNTWAQRDTFRQGVRW